VRNNYNVLSTLLWAVSMGGLSAVLAAAQNKVQGVRGLLLIEPVLNLAAVYAGTGGTDFSSDINTSYGITGSGNSTYSNKTYGHDPCLKPGNAFRNVPMRFYHSASDLVVGKTQNTDTFRAIIANYCRESVVVPTSGTHGDPSNFVPSENVAFAARCFKDPATGYAETQPHRRGRPLSLQRGRW
jgi:pimeloyl-ACP methyl ester carboxylesterase